MANAPKQPVLDVELRVMHAIEAAREEQGISQEALGALVGVSQSQVSRMLSGKRPASFTEMLKLCMAVGLDPAVVIAQQS